MHRLTESGVQPKGRDRAQFSKEEYDLYREVSGQGAREIDAAYASGQPDLLTGVHIC